MKYKEIITMILVCATVVAIPCACFVLYMRFVWLGDHSTEIQEGFSVELIEHLQSKHQLSVPDNAVFVKGINTGGLREHTLILVFELPLAGENLSEETDWDAYVFRALELDDEQWRSAAKSSIAWDRLEEFGGELDRQIDKDFYTFIQYSVRDDAVFLRLWDGRPGEAFPYP